MFQNKVIVIDVQGFYTSNKFIEKEISIAGVDSQIKTFIILPPFKYSRLTIKDKTTNKWLYNHFHGLRWDDGNSTLKDLEEYLSISVKKEENPTVYVKGLEKVNWIKKLIDEEITIYNLDDFNCPNINYLYKNDENTNICKYHRKNKHRCAEKSVTLLRNFITLYLNEENI